MLKAFWHSCVMALMFLSLSLIPAQATELGAIVPNTAQITYTYGGSSVTVLSNTAQFQITAVPTASTIEFLRYFPLAATQNESMNGADYSPSGDLAGPFQSIGPARTSAGTVIDTSMPIPVTDAQTYLPGELIIVRVTDPGQNGDPTRIETIVAVVSATGGDDPGAGGDTMTIRLYETGPDTGVFVAYLPSANGLAALNDGVLTIHAGSNLTATYVDSFDATEVSVDVAAVAPLSTVFDSLTGSAIDGAEVTLIDAATGLPAQVYAIDGITTYPATVVSGQTVTDGLGRVTTLASGEYLFPFVMPGTYYLQVVPPSGYVFSSTIAQSVLEALPTSPSIESGSFGQQFTLANIETIDFDVPVDPSASIVLTKEASTNTGAIGDVIQYTIRVENRDSVPAPVNIRDILPQGFRYRDRSAKLDDGTRVSPVFSADGQTLTFNLSPLLPGTAITISYVLEIGAGTKMGKAINEAVVVDGDGDAISGIARAEVLVEDDLMRTKATLIGRVAEQACDGDADWVRDLENGIGIEGVRIYMETGDYAVSDENGLFHFQGVEPGVHVVQLDEETLPTGFDPMMCEENTRYAGSMTSQFVDVKGGTLWRTNFYLKRNDEYVAPVIVEKAEPKTDEKGEAKDEYGAEWLMAQNDEIAWVYPDTSKTPSAPTANIGIKTPGTYRVKLSLNGKAIPQENFQARDTDKNGRVALNRWRGIDLAEGENLFRAEVKDSEGNTVKILVERIYFVNQVLRAIPLPDQSVLLADGRTTPFVMARFENAAGRPVHAGRIVKVVVDEPYYARDSRLREGEDPLTTSLSSRGAVSVGADGMARIELEPTLVTGRIRLTVWLDDGRTQNINMYMKPEKRDWILVGLAESTLGLEKKNGALVPVDGEKWESFSDGRVALFAKGMVRGDWLLTLAYDSEKDPGDVDDTRFGTIDPNAYYTLYGDRSDPNNEAQSRYPFYVKMERETFQAMFGDYDAALTESKLSRYNRRLTGFKSIYSGERVEVITFAAEANQKYGREELAADGTTGPYQLSGVPIVRYSEKVTVETRDRFRPDIVLRSYPLNRFTDYEVDFLTGRLILRLPLDATDFDFNPNVLVVEYEQAEDAARKLSYGARIEAEYTPRVTLGATAIHEEDPGGGGRGKVDLVGVDAVIALSENTEARLEHSQTTRENAFSAPGETAPRSGSAVLAEVVHNSENLTAEIVYQRQGEGFGLGQQSSSLSNAERLSGKVTRKISDTADAGTGKRKVLRFESKGWFEKQLSTGVERAAADVMLTREIEGSSAGLGMRWVEDRVPGEDDRQSTLAIATLRHTFPEQGITITATHESPVNGRDESSEFPQRTILGLDKQINSKATLTLRHEILDGPETKGENSSVGLALRPWSGSTITGAVDKLTQDSSYRVGATIGVDQTVKINDKWSASLGGSRHNVLDALGAFENFIGDDPISQTELSEDFSSYYGGIGFRTDKTSVSARAEYRDAESDDRNVVTVSAAREVSEQLSLAGVTRAEHTIFADETDETRVDARIGLAYRPRGEGNAYLYRFDYRYDQDALGVKTTRLVSNLAANFDINERFELSLHHGLKFVEIEHDADFYDGFTHLLGAEGRLDVTEKIDLGFHATGLWSEQAKTVEYAYGPSIGFAPADNVWISAGYNISGFEDEDFDAAEYRQRGPYVQFRMKVDQNTARGLLDRISPRK